MSRIAYVNGRYLRHRDASVHVEDRALQFGDGVYEVCEVRNGRLIDEQRHLARLARSLAAIRIPQPMDAAAVGVVLRELVRRNRVVNGIVYLQVTRGTAPRNHPFPLKPVRPGVMGTAKSLDVAEGGRRAEQGIAVVTAPDNRWGRVDIKTVGLLPNVLAKQTARATDDIAGKIAAIQSATRGTVETNASIRNTVQEVQASADRIRGAMEVQAQTVTAITAAVDETALAADSMSATIGAIREETESVASDIERVGAGFAALDAELGTLKNSAGEFVAKVAA